MVCVTEDRLQGYECETIGVGFKQGKPERRGKKPLHDKRTHQSLTSKRWVSPPWYPVVIVIRLVNLMSSLFDIKKASTMASLASLPIELIEGVAYCLKGEDFLHPRETCSVAADGTFRLCQGYSFTTQSVMVERQSMQNLIESSRHPLLQEAVKEVELCVHHLIEPEVYKRLASTDGYNAEEPYKESRKDNARIGFVFGGDPAVSDVLLDKDPTQGISKKQFAIQSREISLEAPASAPGKR
ncbi:hypothetical protein CCHR01_19616 [Colletotrichum chrysophilum]|uniref:Uncharacterized protein n=1 Tax=Colletotrichum chrysophilum TaxID=1836956 RepID=A0AAD8ZZC7_9PEZI|nr:hypothetical protein CCHR01_19616 [Colletotrichum chrysophilum]